MKLNQRHHLNLITTCLYKKKSQVFTLADWGDPLCYGAPHVLRWVPIYPHLGCPTYAWGTPRYPRLEWGTPLTLGVPQNSMGCPEFESEFNGVPQLHLGCPIYTWATPFTCPRIQWGAPDLSGVPHLRLRCPIYAWGAPLTPGVPQI